MQVGIAALDATLVARVAATQLHGRRYAVVAIAVGEAFPEGALAGVAAYWGCVRQEGAGWEPPPAGWHTLPGASYSAGMLPLKHHAPTPHQAIHPSACLPASPARTHICHLKFHWRRNQKTSYVRTR